MTLIASWVATDDKPEGKKISAVYFCADSRFTWSPTGMVYDMGKKVYSCKSYPEIFCFCGDVEFPTITIQSLVDEIDNEVLFDTNSSIDVKKSVITGFILQSFQNYPKDVLAHTFSIYHASCINQEFYITEYSYNGRSVEISDHALPSKSQVVFSAGSGKSLFDRMWLDANKVDVNELNTSRNVYNCLSRTIDECKLHPDDKNLSMVGGCPQLVGLYRGGKTQIYGIIKDRERYIHGRRVNYSPILNKIEWRNDNFERVNPETMELLTGAQAQPFAPRKKAIISPTSDVPMV